MCNRYRTTRGGQVLCCAIALALLTGAPLAAKLKGTIPVTATFSGWWLQTGTTNVDAAVAGHSTSSVQSNLGTFEAGARTESLPWDGVTLCWEPDRGVPIGIVLVKLNDSSVWRFDDGSMIFTRFIEGINCFDWQDGSSTFDFDSEIVGGTGLFAGATGTISTSGIVHGGGPGAVGYTGTVTGTLVLP